jgi:hypothetical protein
MGRIIAVILKKSELKQIAKSKNVKGTLAGEQFRWSFNNRKPLRLLVSKLKKSSN